MTSRDGIMDSSDRRMPETEGVPGTARPAVIAAGVMGFTGYPIDRQRYYNSVLFFRVVGQAEECVLNVHIDIPNDPFFLPESYPYESSPAAAEKSK